MHQLDRLPSEVLVKILGFTIDGDLNQLNKVKNTSPEWNKITHDIQFYLISLPANAQFLSHAICTHWSVKIIFIGQSM